MPQVASQSPDPEEATGEAFTFAEYDVVALLDPWPAVGLEAGVWGNVLKLHPDGSYEVEFTERDGTPLMKLRVPGGKLELVWADPG